MRGARKRTGEREMGALSDVVGGEASEDRGGRVMLVRYGCVWERFGSCIGCAILIEAVREKHGPPY